MFVHTPKPLPQSALIGFPVDSLSSKAKDWIGHGNWTPFSLRVMGKDGARWRRTAWGSLHCFCAARVQWTKRTSSSRAVNLAPLNGTLFPLQSALYNLIYFFGVSPLFWFGNHYQTPFSNRVLNNLREVSKPAYLFFVHPSWFKTGLLAVGWSRAKQWTG